MTRDTKNLKKKLPDTSSDSEIILNHWYTGSKNLPPPIWTAYPHCNRTLVFFLFLSIHMLTTMFLDTFPGIVQKRRNRPLHILLWIRFMKCLRIGLYFRLFFILFVLFEFFIF